MAFQPVIDIETGAIVSHEALVRGPYGGDEASVKARVTERNRQDFDRKCWLAAIETAAALDIDVPISINFAASAVLDPDDLVQSIQWAADAHDFPLDLVILEFSETDGRASLAHMKEICRRTRAGGICTALDDFGAGDSGLSRLADLYPALVKLDVSLVRGIDTCKRRRVIVAGALAMCLDLGLEVVAKGVQAEAEMSALRDCGIRFMQGNLLAAPVLEGAMTPSDLSFPEGYPGPAF